CVATSHEKLKCYVEKSRLHRDLEPWWSLEFWSLDGRLSDERLMVARLLRLDGPSKQREAQLRRGARFTRRSSWPGAPPPWRGCRTTPCCTTGGRGPSSGPQTAASRQTHRTRGSTGNPRSRSGRPLPPRRGVATRRG